MQACPQSTGGVCLQPLPCWHSLEVTKELLMLSEVHLPPADLSLDLQERTKNRSQQLDITNELQKSKTRIKKLHLPPHLPCGLCLS